MRDENNKSVLLRPLLALLLVVAAIHSYGQQKNIDGQTFKQYKPSAFKPRHGLNYSLYVAPLITVDPLGLGGKSTYALSVGSQIRLWESKSITQQRSGLKVKGWYTAVGYEYYPQRADNLYASLWFRVRTFMPLAARADYIYTFGKEGRGTSVRYGFGIELKRITILACGVYYRIYRESWGFHPYTDSPYAYSGAVTVIIPVYNHFPSDK